MKKSISIIISALILLFTNTAFKPKNEFKVLTVINKAEWCKVCKLYAVRAIAAFNENNRDGYFQFLENDVTNDSTKLKSKPELIKVGLEKMMKKNTTSGILSFYDVETKKLLAQVTVASTKNELAETMKLVRAETSK
jgi:hypothetical protein